MLATKGFSFIFPAAASLAISANAPASIDGEDNAIARLQPLPISRPQSNFTDSNSFTGCTSWLSFQSLQMSFEIKDTQEVFGFLNEPITNLLVDTYAALSDFFVFSKASLSLVSDSEDGSNLLYLTIHSKTDWQDSEARLDKFDEAWWLKQKWLPTSKRICVDVVPA